MAQEAPVLLQGVDPHPPRSTHPGPGLWGLSRPRNRTESNSVTFRNPRLMVSSSSAAAAAAQVCLDWSLGL